MSKHPMQPVHLDAQGTIRFKPNKIVRFMLDHGVNLVDAVWNRKFATDGLSLNILAGMDFPQEDWEQFYQLIGYSISGYHELSFVSDASATEASLLAKKILPEAGGCRDSGCPYHGDGK